jgi:2-oxoglutarate ferredoxin oxidoreductase subunit beta
MGQFAHIMRRRINMLYIVDNNGTYGLTKGQFSATNDKGSTPKKGAPNLYEPIDLVSMALQIGASFVARSFSGDKHQLVPLIKAGLRHKGMAFIDIISPCVAFNNHQGSTKSYDHVRQYTHAVVNADYVEEHDEITVDYLPGTREDVAMPDGSTLRLYKLDDAYDPHDRIGALNYIQRHQEEGGVVTGMLYVDPLAADCHEIMDTVQKPLNELLEDELCPGNNVLQSINESFR